MKRQYSGSEEDAVEFFFVPVLFQAGTDVARLAVKPDLEKASD